MYSRCMMRCFLKTFKMFLKAMPNKVPSRKLNHQSKGFKVLVPKLPSSIPWIQWVNRYTRK